MTTRSFRSPRRPTAVLGLMLLAASGCGGGSKTGAQPSTTTLPRVDATTPAPTDPATTAPPAPSRTPAAQPGATPSIPVTPGVSRTVAVRAAVLSLGAVPADGFALPLPSPDGAHVAVQSGVAPEWSTALGEAGAPLPDATDVAVYDVSFEEKRSAHGHDVGAGVLLGRSADAEGFLVEQPTDRGSRRVGKVSWSSGQVRWLVDDDSVNAFAVLDARGRLAWSRRTIASEHFELAVRGPDGSAWTLGGPGQDWVMPAWSGVGDGLFAIVVEDGQLDLVHVVARGASAARQSIRREPLTSSGSVYTAYQAMIGQPVLATERATREHLVFYHPRHHRAAIWRPSDTDRAVTLLPARTLTAVMDPGGFVLAPTGDDLLLVRLESSDEPDSLLKGLLIPRPTPAAPYPYLMLTPNERSVGLTAVDLLE